MGGHNNHGEHEPFYKSLKGIITTTHHTDIGIMYLTIAVINLLIAGSLAMIIRAQLGGINVVSPDQYLGVVSLHGTAMLFFVVTPFFAGIANYVLPKMVGAPDLYWPKINAFAFWMFAAASIVFWLSFLDLGNLQIGWTGYAPLSTYRTLAVGYGIDLWILGILLFTISSTLGAINFIMTTFRLKSPDLKLSKIPLFVWSFISAQFLILYAFPPFIIALIMLFLERNLAAPFFDPNRGGDPILYQNLFWFMGHPEVYILVLPAFGLVSEVLPRMARKPIYGYKAIALSSVMILVLSFFVWAHHMFTVGLGIVALMPFVITTMAVAIPSGIKVFNWTATLYKARIRFRAPMIYVIGFLTFFIIGGITGVFFPVIPVDIPFQDTYFVLGHFHYVVNAILVAIMAGLFYYFPYMTGRMYHEGLGKLSALMIIVGGGVAFTSFLTLGILGMPRRYYEPPPLPQMEVYSQIATAGSILMGLGVVVALLSMIYGLFKGKQVDRNDPWKATKMGMPDFHPAPMVNGAGISHRAPHPWMTITGLATMLLPLGLLFIIKWGMTVIGTLLIVLFFATGIAWLVAEYFRPKTSQYLNGGAVAAEAKPLLQWGVARGLLGLDAKASALYVITTEIFLFGSAIASYFYLMRVNPTWPPPPTPHLETLVPIINTVVLLSSGAVMHYGYIKFKQGDVESFRALALGTMILGSLFLGGQAYEYVTSGMTLATSVYSSMFFLLTGIHGLHVLMGLIAIAVLIARSHNGSLPVNTKGESVVEAVTLYWHFVDLIWIVLFSILYLIPFQIPAMVSGA